MKGTLSIVHGVFPFTPKTGFSAGQPGHRSDISIKAEDGTTARGTAFQDCTGLAGKPITFEVKKGQYNGRDQYTFSKIQAVPQTVPAGFSPALDTGNPFEGDKPSLEMSRDEIKAKIIDLVNRL